MVMRFAYAFSALMLGAGCALFSGCASLRPANDLSADTQDADINTTRYQGRFSTHYTQNSAEQSAVDSFLWCERGPDVQFELTLPLDQMLVIVSQSNQGATPELSNQLPCRTPEVNTPMQDVLGFSLPVSGLCDWLCARPVPDIPARVACDAQSHLETTGQNGWTVYYVVWIDDGNNTDGAKAGIRRLDLDRPQDTNGPLSIWLVLDQ